VHLVHSCTRLFCRSCPSSGISQSLRTLVLPADSAVRHHDHCVLVVLVYYSPKPSRVRVGVCVYCTHMHIHIMYGRVFTRLIPAPTPHICPKFPVSVVIVLLLRVTPSVSSLGSYALLCIPPRPRLPFLAAPAQTLSSPCLGSDISMELHHPRLLCTPLGAGLVDA
jgi:hypothetical protein